MKIVIFLIATLGVTAVLGSPVAAHPKLTHLSLPARASVAWAAGCLFLTALLTAASAAGLRWRWWLVLLTCGGSAAVSVWMKLSARSDRSEGRFSSLPAGRLTHVMLAVIGGGTFFSFIFGFATSADLSYFWGVKAVHFALEGGIDLDLLRQPFMIHLHPNYPPLWPVLLAWGAFASDSMPWIAIPSLTWVCVSAAAAIIFSTLELHLGARTAAIVTCFWYGVLGAMTVTSFSGGNAEGPLLLFLSIALVIVLTETEEGDSPLRWLAALALAGAVLTKSEGVVGAALISIGTFSRDLIWRRSGLIRNTVFLVAPSVTAFGLWAAFKIAHDLPLTDPIRETAFDVSLDHVGLIVRICIRLLTTGVVAAGWLVPLISVVAAGRGRLIYALPAVVTALGVLVFAFTYYLHSADNPLELIVWTFPRLIQPAMSAWILGLGISVFSTTGPRKPLPVLGGSTAR